MANEHQTNYFVHTLLRARDWQHRPEFDQVCDWWRGNVAFRSEAVNKSLESRL